MSTAPLSITETAAEHVLAYAAKENAPAVLRVGIRGGGCSGFKYQLAFDVQRDDDLAVESNGVTLLIAAAHLPYLTGSVVDYVDGLMGAGFQVSNPNAVAACGCGDSFRIDDTVADCGATPADDPVYL